MIDNILDEFVSIFNIKGNEEGRDSAFEILSASVAFNKSPYYIVKNSWLSKSINDENSSSGQDGKIDAYDIVVDDKNEEIIVKLLQSKHSDGIGDNDAYNYFNSIYDHICDINSNLTENFSKLKEIRDKIESEVENSKYLVRYEIFITVTSITKKRREFLETIYENKKFINAELIIIDSSDITKYLNKQRNNISDNIFNDVKYNIELDTNTDLVVSGKTEVVVSSINDEQVRKIINEEFNNNYELSRLFSNNVRGFLEETKVNESMKKTLFKNPRAFFSLNNGAVIVVDKLTKNRGKQWQIKNPRIINGQQTMSMIYLEYGERKKHRVSIPVKIIATKEMRNIEKFLEDVSRASNESNPIDETDLITNKPIVKMVKKHFSDKKIYLKIKNGETLNDFLFKGDTIIEFIELVKIWYAVSLGRPNDSKKTTSILNIFNEAYIKDNPKQVLIDMDNKEKILETFDESYNVYSNKEKLLEGFGDENYSKHADYYIFYLIKKEFNTIPKSLDKEQLKHIKNIIENNIKQERKHLEIDGREYTANNYFKSTRPILHYLRIKDENIKKIPTVNESLNKLF